MKRNVCLALLLAMSAALSGCSPAIPRSPQSFVTLPPVEAKYSAPEGDGAPEYAETVQLCLPALSDGQLMMLPERILLPQDRHPGETVLKKLFSFQGNERAGALFPEAMLQLQPAGFEISGDVATVNLGAAAGLLKGPDLFTLRRAIANTLTQWQDIRYVNVLVDGREPGMAPESPLPIGSLQQTRNEDAPALWDSLSARASLQDQGTQRFPASAPCTSPRHPGGACWRSAHRILRGQTAAADPRAAGGAVRRLQAQPQLPRCQSHGAAGRPAGDLETGGWLRHPPEAAADRQRDLYRGGHPRSVMLASLSFTLSTFIPG